MECGPRWIWQRRRWHRARIRTPARTSGSGLPWRTRWPIRWPSRRPARRPTRKLTRWPNPCPTGVANGPGCRDRRQLYRVLTHRARFAISGAQAAGPPRRRNLPLRRPCRPLCGPHLPLRRRRRPPRRQRKRDGLTPPRLARRHRHRGHPFDEPAVHRQAHRPTNLAYAGHAAHPRQTVAWGLAYICRNGHLRRDFRWHNLSRPACQLRRHFRRQVPIRRGEQPHPPGRSPDIQRLLTLPRHPPPMRVCGAFVRAFPFGVRGSMLRPPPIHRRPRATAAGARQRPATCRKVGVGIAARIDAVPTKRGATRTHLAAPHRVKMPNGRLRGDGAPAR